MSGFPRNVEAALSRQYDVIVVGAGIYGLALTLEASRTGLRVLLLEKDDFGGATSLNSLRILHGGLRYLQHLDFPRVFESIQQRGWFMHHFRPLCRALPCMMPLYGVGLKRPSTFRVALALNNALSGDFPRGQVLTRTECEQWFPKVRREGLQGAALWYDGQVLSPQRLHAEMLRWAAARGAAALNYVEVLELKRQGGRVAGVATNVGDFHASTVINAAGPWSREVAKRLDQDRPELINPFLTFNVLLKVQAPSEAAVAVQSSRMYFVTPHQSGLTFAGTYHTPWKGAPEPTEEMLEDFIADLNAAVPGWGVKRSDVFRVTPGVLPTCPEGKPEMAHRSVFAKHDVEGLYSICGIKYTTAQRFAQTTLEKIFGKRQSDASAPEIGERGAFAEPRSVMALPDSELLDLVEEEAVTRPEDLIERRMDWVFDDAERSQFHGRLETLLLAEHSV